MPDQASAVMILTSDNYTDYCAAENGDPVASLVLATVTDWLEESEKSGHDMTCFNCAKRFGVVPPDAPCVFVAFMPFMPPAGDSRTVDVAMTGICHACATGGGADPVEAVVRELRTFYPDARIRDVPRSSVH